MPQLGPNTLTAIGVAVAFALLVLVLSFLAAGLARGATVRALGRTRADHSTSLLVGRTTYVAVLGLGALTALGLVGVPWATLLALMGGIGLAVGLALQDVLKNFVAGVYLLVERPFRIGEEITVKEFTGRVETVDIRTTTLRTAEGGLIMVPNAILFAEIIINRRGSSAELQPGDQRGG